MRYSTHSTLWAPMTLLASMAAAIPGGDQHLAQPTIRRNELDLGEGMPLPTQMPDYRGFRNELQKRQTTVAPSSSATTFAHQYCGNLYNTGGQRAYAVKSRLRKAMLTCTHSWIEPRFLPGYNSDMQSESQPQGLWVLLGQRRKMRSQHWLSRPRKLPIQDCILSQWLHCNRSREDMVSAPDGPNHLCMQS